MRGRPTFTSLLLAAAKDPWVLLAGALAAGVAWAVGIPVLVAGVVGVAVLGTAAVASVFTGNVPGKVPERTGDRLRQGTAQSHLLEALDAYIGDLANLRNAQLPDVVTDPAIEALSAATGSRESAARVAVAIDGLDAALTRSEQVHARWSGARRLEGVSGSEARMSARRDALLGNLDTAVAEVAEVYTKLLELAATADVATAAHSDDGSVASVNDSLDSLRTVLGDLEHSARPELA